MKGIQLNNKGQYFVSQFKSSLGKSFGTSTRPSINQVTGTPGPGTYVAPSDFPDFRASQVNHGASMMSQMTVGTKAGKGSMMTNEMSTKEPATNEPQ